MCCLDDDESVYEVSPFSINLRDQSSALYRIQYDSGEKYFMSRDAAQDWWIKDRQDRQKESVCADQLRLLKDGYLLWVADFGNGTCCSIIWNKSHEDCTDAVNIGIVYFSEKAAKSAITRANEVSNRVKKEHRYSNDIPVFVGTPNPEKESSVLLRLITKIGLKNCLSLEMWKRLMMF